jgi:hypothetical protein
MRRLGSQNQETLDLVGALALLSDEAVPPDVRRSRQV